MSRQHDRPAGNAVRCPKNLRSLNLRVWRCSRIDRSYKTPSTAHCCRIVCQNQRFCKAPHVSDRRKRSYTVPAQDFLWICVENQERLFFRRIFTAKKWINPGFLHGPYLPIYGFGACLMYAVSEVDLNISESPALNLLIRFLVSAFLLTAIEYIGGLIFIRLMKIRLWDYSKRKA